MTAGSGEGIDDDIDNSLDMELAAGHIGLDATMNLPVLTLEQKKLFEDYIADLTHKLRLAEHKRQETLVKNTELLQKVAEKDTEIAAANNRLNLLKSKTANGVIKEELQDLKK